jgi:hypothetical protein
MQDFPRKGIGLDEFFDKVRSYLTWWRTVIGVWYNTSMVKILGNDIWRGGEKIGWIDGDHIRDRDGKKLGYFEDKYVYNLDGRKIAYIEEDHLVSVGSGNEAKVDLDKVAEEVQGGVLSELGKCAVYVLLGD